MTKDDLFASVRDLERRAAELEKQAAQLEAQDRTLSRQIAECHASGTGDLDALTRERRDVRERRADILDALPLVREKLAREREAAGRAAAAARQTGIARAYGSLARELDDDEVRIKEAAAAYKAGVDRLNQRFRSLALLKAEAAALMDRFGVTAPTLAPVVVPAMREGLAVASVKFLDTGYVSPKTEHDEHDLRTRRTYQEVSGTPGGEIIEAAGRKPWPDLTPKQREIVASRERQRQQEAASLARFAAEVPRTVQRDLAVPMS